MAATSAALLLWRAAQDHREYLIVHPGGPFWARKDEGAWSLPKGEFDPASEDGLAAAKREFAEELGSEPPPEADYVDIGSCQLKSGKKILAWAVEGDLDTDTVVSNTFEMEWPPRSGKRQSFPEVDRALWCNADTARSKLNPAQAVFVDRTSALS